VAGHNRDLKSAPAGGVHHSGWPGTWLTVTVTPWTRTVTRTGLKPNCAASQKDSEVRGRGAAAAGEPRAVAAWAAEITESVNVCYLAVES
jgi:hypothetical protein